MHLFQMLCTSVCVCFQSINFEGIVGMGFPDMSSTGATPIYDNIMKQADLKRSEFAFYVAKDSPVSRIRSYFH